ncbi:flagellar hook assembly protein FlgD [Algihabitans albus]|uniref:flagellar hook assembly protein FlgD n=1 Tax=Algihabitans albus TaxID=2164067 RepID=UPI0013C37155|nr:flagellar hook capping FlgD N-terminal domain-containing protein [Algihabitans albus]
MNEISNALGVPGTGGGDAAASKDSLGETFDDFLTLLTTQLQYQDPLSPMDSTQFTEQLVHFTNVEQGIAQNEKLEELLAQNSFNTTAQAVGFIGKEVEMFGEFVVVGDGGPDDMSVMSYGLARDASETTIKIFDDSGEVVRELIGKTAAGAHELNWDGRDENGIAVPPGIYAIEVEAVGSNDEPIGTAGRTEAVVQAVSTNNGRTFLDIGGIDIPLEDVIAIRQQPEEGSTETAN